MADLAEKGKKYMEDAQKKLSGSKGFLGGMFGSVFTRALLPVTVFSLTTVSHMIVVIQHQCAHVPLFTCNMVDHARIIVSCLSLIRISLHMILISIRLAHPDRY